MDQIIKIRVSADDKAAFETAAAQADQSLSSWARGKLRFASASHLAIQPAAYSRGATASAFLEDGTEIEWIVTRVTPPKKGR